MKTRSTVHRTLLFVGVAAVIGAALLLNTDSNRGNKASAAPDSKGDSTTPNRRTSIAMANS